MVLTKSNDKKKGDVIEHDEIKQYLDCRYVTPHEAYWRIMSYKLEEKSHVVMRLNFHLPEEQTVSYKKGDDISKKSSDSKDRDTHLTAWFKLNENNTMFSDGSYARGYYFYEIPEICTFAKHGNNMIWRERLTVGKPTIARMYTIDPKQGELCYLRMLLLHKKGATSYQDLKTVIVDGQPKTCSTFREAAVELGLLDEGKMWFDYFREIADIVTNVRNLRELFVTLMYHGENIDFEKLFEDFKEDMAEDFVNKGITLERAINLAKADIQRQLQIANFELEDFNMSPPVDVLVSDLEEKFDNVQEMEKFNKMYSEMYDGQKRFVDFVIAKLEEQKSGTLENGCALLEGPGGHGKTHCYKALCHRLRAEGVKFKTSAWMGIAAILLPDGRTMHKNFKLPFDMDKNSVSGATARNQVGKELIDVQVIIVDEISNVPKYAMEMVNKKLQELMDNNLPFGGKIVIIGGDFRQILPVARKAKRSELVSLSIKGSRALWPYFNQNVFCLTKNKRVIEKKDDDGKGDYSKFILKMGNGDLPMDDEEFIEIPEHCIVDEGKLIDEVFGNIMGQYLEMSKRVILTTKNDKAAKINADILERLDNGKITSIYSHDSYDVDQLHRGKAINYTDEFLHSINEGGLPPHELKLIENCVVMLLRNLNPAAGLCNETRLLVKRIHKRFLECEFLYGEKVGERTLIPKIILSNSKRIGFMLHRRQFPVKLCYAMTINKSQGQTIDFVGLDLVDPVFSHGMTYVAFSRVRGWDSIAVAVDKEKGNKVKNVVFKEVLMENAQELEAEKIDDKEYKMDVDDEELCNITKDKVENDEEKVEEMDFDKIDDEFGGMEYDENIPSPEL